MPSESNQATESVQGMLLSKAFVGRSAELSARPKLCLGSLVTEG